MPGRWTDVSALRPTLGKGPASTTNLMLHALRNAKCYRDPVKGRAFCAINFQLFVYCMVVIPTSGWWFDHPKYASQPTNHLLLGTRSKMLKPQQLFKHNWFLGLTWVHKHLKYKSKQVKNHKHPQAIHNNLPPCKFSTPKPYSKWGHRWPTSHGWLWWF